MAFTNHGVEIIELFIGLVNVAILDDGALILLKRLDSGICLV